MSFPSRYASSPASYPRDYALVQAPSTSYRSRRLSIDDIVSEEEAEDAAASHDRSTSIDSHLDEDESIVEPNAHDDGMSNISLPGARSSSRPTPKSSSSAAPSAMTSPRLSSRPSLSRTKHASSSTSASQSRSYGAVATDIESGAGASSSSSNAAAAAAAAGVADQLEPHSLGPVPARFLLGGEPIPPPAMADLSEDWEDTAPTPMPRPAWLGSNEPTPRPTNGNGKEPEWPRASLSAATSPLLAPPTSMANPAERSPLLPRHAGESGISIASFVSAGGTRRRRQSWTAMGEPPLPTAEELVERLHDKPAHPRRHEAWLLTKSATPIFVTHLLEFSLNVVSVFSLGHLGTTELAAAALASMTANLTGYSLMNGFISALDTILPSAYAAAPKSVGLWTQRMLVLLCGLLFFVLLTWRFSYHILMGLGQDPEVALLASSYLRYLSIGLVPYACFEVQRRYLQAQGLFHASTVVLCFVSPLNALLNVYLVHFARPGIRLGFIGAPIASSISSWVMFLLMSLQCRLAPRIAWGGWSWGAFKELGVLLSLGMAGIAQVCSEWCAWEIVGLMTSKLGTINLAAQSVLLTSSSISYQLPYSLSVAASVRVSSALGAALPEQAKLSSDVSMLGAVLVGGLNSFIFVAFRRQIGMAFASDSRVIEAVAIVFPLVAAFQVADSICGVAGGVLRGMGRQHEAALINVTAYYVIGLPLGILLAFSRINLGLSGLWLGLTVALVYGGVGTTLLVRRTDWFGQVEKMRLRMGITKDGEEEDESQHIVPVVTTAH